MADVVPSEADRTAGVDPRAAGSAVLAAYAGAAAVYVLAYASAIRLSFSIGFGTALLYGLANAIPESIAAPLILAVAGAPGRARAVRNLALLAIPFVAFSVLLSSLGFAAVYLLVEGTWRYTLEPRAVAWKALISLLAFGVIAAVGLARAYSREAREASARALRAETLRAESRLAILRAQLNPHFILNVLHSLVGLAERDPATTASALERLGTTLRYALRVQSRGSDRVPLRDELSFTREYLELERLRLGDRLETRFDVDGAPAHRVVPPFVLQPLVENAVVHAISPRARGGVVAIRIEEDAGVLILSVDDDGPGQDGTPGAGTGNGLGLKLLRDRLEALYGAGAALTLDRSPLGGTRATLRLTGEPTALDEPQP